MLLFRFGTDDKELTGFIKRNFVIGKAEVSKVRINKNNFTTIYSKWLAEVKPTISVNWEVAKRNGIIDADFYLADILSEHNVTSLGTMIVWMTTVSALRIAFCAVHAALVRRRVSGGPCRKA